MDDFGNELRGLTSGGRLGGPTSWDRYDPGCNLQGKRSVYVIQLTGWKIKSPLGALYVGQTGQTLAARFQQHQTGHDRGAKGLEDKCRRLRPELYLDLPLFSTKAEACDAELARAQKLRGAGYAVECNGAPFADPGRNHRDLFGDEDLQRLPLRLRQKLVDVMDTPGASDDELVHALRWCADPDCRALPEDVFPVEWVGRLAHVEESVVAALVSTLRERAATGEWAD